MDVDDGREISVADATAPGYGDVALLSSRMDGVVVLYFSSSAWAGKTGSIGDARKSRGPSVDAVVGRERGQRGLNAQVEVIAGTGAGAGGEQRRRAGGTKHQYLIAGLGRG